MGLFGRKKQTDEKPLDTKADVKVEKDAKVVKKEVAQKSVAKKTEVKIEKKAEKKTEVKVEKKGVIKGGTDQAYKILVKPLITEKATELGALNKYVFEINPKMNKVEVKKAIRSIYNVDPIAVNIANFAGKKVRFGKVKGRRRAWKKAIITLRKGDKIEVYEGV